MSRRTEILKDGALVTAGSLVAMILAFGLYYLIFLLLETVSNRGGGYNFVSYLRVGYGIAWLVLCLIFYRTRIPEWLKASILSGSLTAFMSAIGVQLYQNPALIGAVMFAVVGATVLVLAKTRQKWFNYYAVALSLLAALFYL